MQPFYKKLSVLTGFGVLLAILIVNTLVIRRQVSVQVASHDWVSHTEQVLLQLERTESLMKDAGTGQRGYLYTGDPQYLEPYEAAAKEVAGHLDQLTELTKDNPRQRARMPQLRQLTSQKLQELAATISLYRAGDATGARALVLTNAGLHTMDKIRSLASDMETDEASLEAVRIREYQRSVRVTVACIYLASVLAAIALFLLAQFVLRQMRTREKHAAEIKQREEWFRVTLTSIGDAVIATDEHGRTTFINPVAEKLTRRDFAWAKGKPVEEVFPIYNELTGDPVPNPVSKVLKLGRVVGLANHTVLERKDGTRIPIEDSAAPIRNDQGQLVGVVLVFRDATAERNSQELLRKTEKIAAAARLAATMAHEINNPLEAVGNLLFLAKGRPGVPEAALHDLKQAEEELARVSHVTRQTLGFYRESTSPDALDMPELVDSVIKLYWSKCKSKNIVVEREFLPGPSLRGWAGELRQVVSNLLSNAIDATPPGGTIKLRVSCVTAPDGQALELRVEDNGTGIPPQHLSRLFEPFFTTKKEVGTGLGLWVSKQIVERHGGTITVESNTGHGTVFTVALPALAKTSRLAAQSA